MNLHDGTMVTDSEMIKDFDELAPLGGISYFKDEVIQVIPNDVQIKDEIFDMDSIKAPSSDCIYTRNVYSTNRILLEALFGKWKGRFFINPKKVKFVNDMQLVMLILKVKNQKT